MLSCNQKALALRHTLTTFIAQCEGSKETPETLLSACIKTDTTSRSLQQEDNPNGAATINVTVRSSRHTDLQVGLDRRSPASCKTSRRCAKVLYTQAIDAYFYISNRDNKTATSSWKESASSYSTRRRRVFFDNRDLTDGLSYGANIILGTWSR